MTNSKADKDDDDPGPSNRDRWSTGADGIEQAGTVTATEDLATPEQKARSAERARIVAESLARAQAMTDDGEADDDDDDEDSDSARKD